jgi:hypothetical protein
MYGMNSWFEAGTCDMSNTSFTKYNVQQEGSISIGNHKQWTTEHKTS